MRYLPVTGGETGTYESSSVIKLFLQTFTCSRWTIQRTGSVDVNNVKISHDAR